MNLSPYVSITLCVLLSVLTFLLILQKRKLMTSIVFATYRFHIAVVIIISFSIIGSLIFKLPGLYRFCANFFFKVGLQLEENFSDIPKNPCILMSNYSAKTNILGYMAHMIIPHKFCLVLSNSNKNIVDRIYEKDKLIYVDNKKGNYQKIKEEIKDKVEKGYYIFCYIEDIAPEKRPYKIKKLRSGIFNIAKELNIPIVPMVTDSIPTFYGLATFSKFRIRIGEQISVKNTEKAMGNVLRWMQKNLNIMSIRA